jgi:hypothetical protein
MKIVTGIFTQEEAIETIGYLTDNGFMYEDLSLISSAADIPEYLEGEAEESAVSGAVVGGVAGSALAALGTWATPAIPGFESMMVAGLLTTTLGGVVGAYLGSLYNLRAETKTGMEIDQALEAGKMLLVVRADGMGAETATSFMTKGENVETHEVAAEDFNEEG